MTNPIKLPDALNKEYAERIRSLLDHQELHSRELLDLGKRGKINPNCHGTTTFVLGTQDLISGPEEFMFYEGYIFVKDRPGCIARAPMTRFLTDYCHEIEEDYSPGDIITIWVEKYIQTLDNLQTVLEHSGILLYPQSLFHQPDTGQKFEFASIEDYIANEFAYCHKDLSVRYFRLK